MSIFNLFDVYAAIFFTWLLAPLLALAAILLWLNRRLGQPEDRSPQEATIAAVLFLLGDLLLAALLPVIGVSFGKQHFNVAMFLSIRLALYLPWLALRLKGPHRQGMTLFFVVNGLVSLLLFYVYIVEPSMITVSRVQVDVTDSSITRPVRIVQLSDIHMERTSLRDVRLPELVSGLQPDMIVLTGDYLSNSNMADPQAMRDVHVLAAQLHAPLGVYAVEGTVDNQAGMSSMFTGTDVQILDNEAAYLSESGIELDLLGISDRMGASRFLKHQAPQLLRPGSYHLLLYHTPDLIEFAAEKEVDLYLAGHTHGGQVRVPFYGAVITFSRFGKRFEMGRYQVGPTTLYVSRGLGMEGYSLPRIRFLSPPEVVLIELVPVSPGR